jgi:hypothetical protein
MFIFDLTFFSALFTNQRKVTGLKLTLSKRKVYVLLKSLELKHQAIDDNYFTIDVLTPIGLLNLNFSKNGQQLRSVKMRTPYRVQLPLQLVVVGLRW